MGAAPQRKRAAERKQKLDDAIARCVGEYGGVYKLEVSHPKSAFLQKIRDALAGKGRLVFGKYRMVGKVLQRSAGAGAAADVARLFAGPEAAGGDANSRICFAFTSIERGALEALLAGISYTDYALPGTVSEADIVLRRGEVTAASGVKLSNSLLKELAKGGLALETNKLTNSIELAEDSFSVVRAGDCVSEKQSALLRLLGHRTMKYSVRVVGAARWDARE